MRVRRRSALEVIGIVAVVTVIGVVIFTLTAPHTAAVALGGMCAGVGLRLLAFGLSMGGVPRPTG
jgi:hypothetical protein